MYYTRHHKGMAFYPTALQRTTKREINKQLVEHRKDIDGRIADKYYFRIYQHKGQRYTLYVGPEKAMHGGLRRRSKTGARNMITQVTQPTEVERNGVEEIRDHFAMIETGPHSGKYKNKETGDILTENQLQLAMIKGMKKKY